MLLLLCKYFFFLNFEILFVLVLMPDVVLHEGQVRAYARSFLSAKIRWIFQKISASSAGMKHVGRPERAINL